MLKGPVYQDLHNLMNFVTRSVRDIEIIPESFKVTVISTALSGVEDNM